MSPAERVQTFISQMIGWGVSFHAEKKSDSYKHDSEYRRHADVNAKAQLMEVFSENLSIKSLSTLGAARLETLGTGWPPEYDQTVLVDSETSSCEGWTVDAIKPKGIKQRYRYALVLERGTPKIDGVSIWRNSVESWERRNAI